ncbi:hypothetical protein AKJ56_00315 [candidate division MSBL1 archaeon SCGC-AAA382N08]|uniref:Uncharacterized protein n=1 Tax=candidate division MSBL1 archaeon SCGC-AAA382N08 TaxID=1698285 RepID=A0A133VQW9_9EURY|nr:hypothetical protein AKJ56_00315 [candidate division MSBL1 archaeon SCGC-AAA382N08]
MGFVVYVDDSEDYAKVHKESCELYQERDEDEIDTIHWKSGFETMKEALNYAQKTGKSKVRTCGSCIKN